MKMLRFLLFLLPASRALDPGRTFASCVDGGKNTDVCGSETINGMKPIMGVGLPNLRPPVPPLDPMAVDKIDFQFLTVFIDFLNLDVKGLKNFDLGDTHVDKAKKTWRVEFSVPRLEIGGNYRLQGDFFGVELGLSQGPVSFNATDVTIIATSNTFDNAGKVGINSVDLELEFTNIRISLRCLFPNEDSKTCCKDKWNQSCSPTLAKTIHKFINKDGKKFVKEFQPQISAKIGGIMRNLLQNSLKSLDSRYMVDV